MLSPSMLNDHIPISVLGDGNCMYHALSRGLFGTENHHLHVRLLTALEIIQNRKLYDVSGILRERLKLNFFEMLFLSFKNVIIYRIILFSKSRDANHQLYFFVGVVPAVAHQCPNRRTRGASFT